MNVFNKVTMQTLKKNKTRTIVTIIGIILSAAMICAVTTSVASLYNYLLQNEIYESGNWHGVAEETSKEACEKIGKADEIENFVYFEHIGYAVAEGCKNEHKPYLLVAGTSEGFEEAMPVHITEGRYPESPSEILIPNHLYSNGGVKLRIGDVLTLPIGERISDGYVLGQSNPYQRENEKLDVAETRTYEVVGFYERPSFEDTTYPAYTVITKGDKEADAASRYTVYFSMKNPRNIYSFMKENDLGQRTNRDVLLYSGVSEFDDFTAVVYSLSAIVLLLIMFGSVSLIYNAFSISVSERTKQFGLLSSVGATKKQLRKMVIFEALAVSAAGIPVGVAAGIGGIGITLVIIGSKLQKITDFSIPMRVVVSPVAILSAIVIALLTVLISAWIPSKRATKVSAVEAIRQNRDINVKGKKVKTSPVAYKLFGLPGLLASKHYKRNSKKYRTTVVSLFMSIVLFVSASAFTDYLMQTVRLAWEENSYDISYITEESSFDVISKNEFLSQIKNAKCVTDAVYTKSTMTSGKVEKKYLTKQIIETDGKELMVQSDKNKETIDAGIGIVFVNDSKFEELLQKYKLSREKYFDKENPLAVVVDGNTTFNSEKDKYVETRVLKGDESQAYVSFRKNYEGYQHYGSITDENGKQFELYSRLSDGERMKVPYEETRINLTLESGKTIYEKPFFVDQDPMHLIYIYPVCMMEALQWNSDVRSYFFYIQSTDHAKSAGDIKTLLTGNGFNTTNLFDHGQEVENERNLIMIIRIFAYGFIILISLISAVNVFNTISTNIMLRRREFAMLKSVGMTTKGFNRMMNYECLLYGFRSLLFGIPVSIGITALIWYAIDQGYELAFTIPWNAIGIAVFSVFAVVFSTMIFSMSKIKRENPIDALKNENI